MGIILQVISTSHLVEVGAVGAGIAYVVLAAREHVACWFFGIVNAGLSIYLFLLSKLYAESILYVYYVIAGVYGWYAWRKRKDDSEVLPISVWSWQRHLAFGISGVALAFLLGWILKTFTDARLPLIDAHTTIFSFIATYMVTRKVLENWIYWIVIDAVTVGLYWSRDLFLYAALMAGYTLIALWGWRRWKRRFYTDQE